jgi:hypothetical protein
VITAAIALREHGRGVDLEVLAKRYDQVFAHGMSLYAKQLEAGRAVTSASSV